MFASQAKSRGFESHHPLQRLASQTLIDSQKGLTSGLTRSNTSDLPSNPYNAFIESRKAQGVSKSSLIYYQGLLSRSLEKLGNPYLARPEDIIGFLNTIPPNERGLSTRHAYRRVLNTFYGWLERAYDIPNPVRKVPAPKLDKVIMPTLKLEQIKALLARETTRNKAIIALATASGLRRSELAK